MEDILTYLNEKTAFWVEEGSRLAADDRRDESDLTKIRVNVYGICKSVLQVLGHEKGTEKLAGLRASWEKALEIARSHHDEGKALIEEIKLETLSEIMKVINEV